MRENNSFDSILEKLNKITKILNQHTVILESHSQRFTSINSSLNSILQFGITQFEKQQDFNEKLLSKLDNLRKV